MSDDDIKDVSVEEGDAPQPYNEEHDLTVKEEMVETDTITESEKLTIELPHQNFKMTWDAHIKTTKETKEKRSIINELPILPVGVDEYIAKVEQFPKTEYFKGLKAEEWIDYIEEATNYFMTGNVFKNTLSRDNSEWHQFIESEIGPLCLGKPNFGRGKGPLLTGERAQMVMSAIMNIGSLMIVPAWNTGMWFKFKPPSDMALLALETRIAEEKTMLGRQTNGMVFSNSSSFIHGYLIDLILSCVYDCSYGKHTPDELKKRIKITDIQTLVWGFLCTIYPNGYPLAQPCINNPETCQHIERETISISKLMWVDKSALTPSQIKHMSNRESQMTDAEIDRYQAEHKYSGDKLCNVNDKLKILLSVPTIHEYLESGHRWVEGIERLVTESFASYKQGDERNQYIQAMSNTMVLRQYSHWVKEIQIFEDPSDLDSKYIINDVDTLEEMMTTLSKDPTLVSEIIKHISEYIDQTTIGVVGIPRYNCPACNEDQGKFKPVDQYIIPLDIIRIFFTLQSQRLWKVTYSTLG